MANARAPWANWKSSAVIQKAGLISLHVLAKMEKRICGFSPLSLTGTSVLWAFSSFHTWE